MSLRIVAVAWLLLIVTAVSLCPQPATAQGAYVEIYVNRYEERGRLLIQMRDIFEWLGWVVEWDPYDKCVTAYGEGYTMSLWVDSYQAIVNGQAFALDVPPRLIFGKTLVPLRFVAEVTGCQVDYLGNAVQITDGEDVLMIWLV